MAPDSLLLHVPPGGKKRASAQAGRRGDNVTVRNLEFLFNPKSVVLVGAGKAPSSVGAVLARNLFNGGFEGPVMPVDPSHRVIESVLTYPDIRSLPVTPDLAVISSLPEQVPGIISQLSERGARAAVVVSAGFGADVERRGRALQQAMLDASGGT
jgi:acetyltransferase